MRPSPSRARLEARLRHRYRVRVTTDEELMRGFYAARRQKAERAFATLFRRYWPDTYRRACRYAKDPDAATDIAQSVWLKVAKTRDGNGRWIEEGGSVRSWILTITDNAGRDHVGSWWVKNATQPPAGEDGEPLEDWIGFEIPNYPDPGLIAALRHCLQALQAANRSGYHIFIDREWYEFDWAELAERQRTDFGSERDVQSIVNTCKGRHRAAKKSLKECLESRLDSPSSLPAASEETRP